MRLLLFSALEGHELASMFAAGPLRKFFEFLADYIQMRIDEGDFRPVNPEVAARCLLGMAHYFVLLRKILDDEVLGTMDQTEAVEAIVRIFYRGILKKGDQNERN